MEQVEKLSNVSEFIKQHRRTHKLTQRKLAEYAEVSYSLINRIENEDLNVTVGTLNKAVELLHRNAKWNKAKASISPLHFLFPVHHMPSRV